MARRKRAATRKTSGILAERARVAGIRAHNARLFAAINQRFLGGKERRLSFNAAKIQRVRRKGRIANPRLAIFKARGRAHDREYDYREGGIGRLTAITSKLPARGAFNRLHPRGHDGRFVRKKVGR